VDGGWIGDVAANHLDEHATIEPRARSCPLPDVPATPNEWCGFAVARTGPSNGGGSRRAKGTPSPTVLAKLQPSHDVRSTPLLHLEVMHEPSIPDARVPEPVSWDDAEVASVPLGTVTLLLADIEGSTRLWEERATEMPDELARLDQIVNSMVSEHGGVRPVEMGDGDSFVAGFPAASDAVACALSLQQATSSGLLRLRIGVHTGEVQQREPGMYMGSTINRTARIRDAGHGGQVLVSQTTFDLVQDQLPDDCSLVDLGPCRLRDVDRPVHLWQLRHPDLRPSFPPLRGVEVGRNNLPLQLTSFGGRSAAVRQLHGSLEVDRAVTVTGAGGCGKTRLALQVAAERTEGYAGGTWLVDFAPVNEASAVELLIAEAVGAAPRPGERALDAVAAAVGPLPTLLVLDNCEHLVAECAAVVEMLLKSCAGVRVLATSREPLGFEGEVTFRVPSLAVPEPDAEATLDAIESAEAVQLFSDVPGVHERASGSTSRTRTSWRRSVAGWMGSRWRSSWRLRGCGCCHQSRSSRGCMTDSAC